MILIFSTKPEIVDRIAASLAESHSVSESTAQLLRDVRRKTSTQLVIIGEDIPESDALEAAREIQFLDNTLGVLLLRGRVDLGITTAGMAAGIRAVLPYSDVRGLAEKASELLEFTGAMRARGGGPAEVVKSGAIVLCYSPKGGVGKTTTALNVAGSLAAGGHGNVVVVDLDLQFGDVGVASGISRMDSSIADLDDYGPNIDLSYVRPLLKEVTAGFSLLMAPADPSQALKVTPELISTTLGLLSQDFDWVIVDSPPAFTDGILAAFDIADIQIMVTTPDLASIKNLDVASKTLRKIGLDSAPRLTVVNRFDPKFSDRAQMSVAAKDVSDSLETVVISENSLISESSSKGYVASVGKEGKKVAKSYEKVVAFLVKHAGVGRER